MTERPHHLALRPPRASADELRCWRRAHETGEASRSETGGVAIRAWPVHEPDWKREIVRTDLPSEDVELAMACDF